jgi:hypothetical protein
MEYSDKASMSTSPLPQAFSKIWESPTLPSMKNGASPITRALEK